MSVRPGTLRVPLRMGPILPARETRLSQLFSTRYLDSSDHPGAPSPRLLALPARVALPGCTSSLFLRLGKNVCSYSSLKKAASTCKRLSRKDLLTIAPMLHNVGDQIANSVRRPADQQ